MLLKLKARAALSSPAGFVHAAFGSIRRHHLGALAMVDQLFAGGGGQEPEIARFANHVYADQEIEIIRAEAMLADLAMDP